MTDFNRIEAKLAKALKYRVTWPTTIIMSVLMAILAGLLTYVVVG